MRKNKTILNLIILTSIILGISIIFLSRESNIDGDNHDVVNKNLEEDKKIIINPMIDNFKINIPEKDNIKTGEGSIAIYGESDPTKELTINGRKLEVYYTGNFIERVELNDGVNVVEFKLGDKKKKITVEKEFKIIDSVMPSNLLKLEEGKEFLITAKLYDGAKAYVEVGDNKYDLIQTQTLKDISSKGTTYAEYTAKGIATNSNSGKIKVIATLNYITQEVFGGEVKILKKQEEELRVGELINDSVMVYDDNTIDSIPLMEKSTLPKGVIDYIVSEVVVDNKQYYNLNCGVRVKKEDIKILNNDKDIKANKITDIKIYDRENHTVLRLQTEKNVPFSIIFQPIDFKGLKDGDYSIDNYNINQGIITFEYTESIGNVNLFDNTIFKSVKSSGNEIILDLKNKGEYCGHYSFYDKEGYLNIVFRHKLKKLEGATFIIDPGHGYSGSEWKDTGAKGWNGITEHDLNFKISRLLEEELIKKGVKVIRLKTEEKTYLLKDRGKVARENDADLFVSIHHNSGGFGKINATETYYNTPFSMELAKSINSSLVNIYKDVLFKKDQSNFDRGAKNNWFMVTIERECPSVLIEVGYIDNPQAFNKLIDEEYQKEIVSGIIEGIEKYCYNN